MNRQNRNGKKPNGVLGGLYGVFFMSVWVFGSFSMGAPWWFSALGLPALVTTVHSTWVEWKKYRNSRRNGFDGYNADCENQDPWTVSYPEDTQYGNHYVSDGYAAVQYGYPEGTTVTKGKNFCPYCGVSREPDYEFCGNCGRQLPD